MPAAKPTSGSRLDARLTVGAVILTQLLGAMTHRNRANAYIFEVLECPCAVERCRSSVGAIPTWQLLLQPVAIGAAVEVTKSPKPSMERVAVGDSASRQAVTRVNAEQASKPLMREPTQLTDGEGRRRWLQGSNSIPPAVPPG